MDDKAAESVKVHYEYQERLPLAMLQVLEYELYGIKVLVQLDRRKKSATLVEWNERKQEYEPKEWQFAGRGLEYMNGWIAIFRAMEHAVTQAKIELEYFDQYDYEKAVDLHVALAKIDLDKPEVGEPEA